MFDAGTKFENTCLNSNILKGPDLLNNLLSVLLKFREGCYGVMSDIQQLFHQVLTNQDDQQASRFLWRDNLNQAVEDYHSSPPPLIRFQGQNYVAWLQGSKILVGG